MTTATFSLATSTKSGSYTHRITFIPMGETVRIVEKMWDDMMGDWIGDSRNRTIALAEARSYYRDRKAAGYRPA